MLQTEHAGNYVDSITLSREQREISELYITSKGLKVLYFHHFLSQRVVFITVIFVVFITVIFSSIVFSCSVLCNSAFFFFFYSMAAVSVVFPPCCPVQVLSCALCLHHVFLSEQIKMMMMMNI